MARKREQADEAPQTVADQTAAASAKAFEGAKATAETVTQQASQENRLPADTAVVNPAPGETMDAGSGAFVEPEAAAVDTAHPSVENNPRAATSGVQNGHDWNDPSGRTPADDGFVGQGVDPSVYGR
ncbi:MAG TPA: hypothetical protein VGU45_02110 [Microvirga sp.]|jgi:hypothetical protein|nr:hypothetical protein [Microvirga sp.]